MFTVDTVHKLLLEKSLISIDSLMNGDYEATTLNRRNRNLTITTIKDEDFFVKQVADQNAENSKTLRLEILFYQNIYQHVPDLHQYIPNVKLADLNPLVLILEYYKTSVPLWRFYKKQVISELPSDTLNKIGRLLGKMHANLSFGLGKKIDFGFLKDDLPFIFKLLKPHTSLLAWTSSGGIKFIERLQAQKNVREIFKNAGSKWTANAIIHGDIKLDNFIILSNNHTIIENTIKLVDWEMVQIGDMAWDIAGVLNDFVFWWVITMPDNTEPEEMIKQAKFPLSNIRPGVNAFVDGYMNASGFSERETQDLVERAVFFAGLRILQTSFEISSRFDAMPPIAILLFNMGMSVLQHPQKAAEQLYGINYGLHPASDTCRSQYGA